jgi:hypothetical protein
MGGFSVVGVIQHIVISARLLQLAVHVRLPVEFLRVIVIAFGLVNQCAAWVDDRQVVDERSI